MEDHFFTKHGVVVGCVCVCGYFGMTQVHYMYCTLYFHY